MDEDALLIEGLAGQLCSSRSEGHFAWWHVASEATKERWRILARKQIAEFNERKFLAPWNKKTIKENTDAT